MRTLPLAAARPLRPSSPSRPAHTTFCPCWPTAEGTGCRTGSSPSGPTPRSAVSWEAMATTCGLRPGGARPISPELLGRSDVATTLRVYSHAAAAMHNEAADTLDAVVGAAVG